METADEVAAQLVRIERGEVDEPTCVIEPTKLNEPTDALDFASFDLPDDEAPAKKARKRLHRQSEIAASTRRLKRHLKSDLRFLQFALFETELTQLKPALNGLRVLSGCPGLTHTSQKSIR